MFLSRGGARILGQGARGEAREHAGQAMRWLDGGIQWNALAEQQRESGRRELHLRTPHRIRAASSGDGLDEEDEIALKIERYRLLLTPVLEFGHSLSS